MQNQIYTYFNNLTRYPYIFLVCPDRYKYYRKKYCSHLLYRHTLFTFNI